MRTRRGAYFNHSLTVIKRGREGGANLNAAPPAAIIPSALIVPHLQYQDTTLTKRFCRFTRLAVVAGHAGLLNCLKSNTHAYSLGRLIGSFGHAVTHLA